MSKMSSVGNGTRVVASFPGFPGGSVVKNLPAMRETWLPSLGQKVPLEEETGTCSSILTWRLPWNSRGARQATVHGVTEESDTP